MASSKAVIVTLLLTCKKVPTGKAEPLQPAVDHNEMQRIETRSAHGQCRLQFRHSGSRSLHLLRGHRLASTSLRQRWRHTLPSSVLKTGKRRSKTRTGYIPTRRRLRPVGRQRLQKDRRLHERHLCNRMELRRRRNRPMRRGPSTKPLLKSQSTAT